MAGILGAIITGAIIGALGRLVLPGKQNIPIWLTILIGIVAAFVGGLVLSLFGYQNGNGGFAWLYYVVGAIMAALGIVGYGAIIAKR